MTIYKHNTGLDQRNSLKNNPNFFNFALPDTSKMSLREELKARMDGILPIIRTDPKTGRRYPYYFGRDDKNKNIDTHQEQIHPHGKNYFVLPEDCHNPHHDLRMHLRQLHIKDNSIGPDHTGYSLVSRCDDGRRYINMQDLARSNNSKITFKHNFAPAQTYQTDHGDVTWSTEIPKDMKAYYKDMIPYLNDKKVIHQTIATDDEAIRAFNLMGFENELINAIPEQQKPEYGLFLDNCNTSTQWKKDNHFSHIEGDIDDIMDNGVFGDGKSFSWFKDKDYNDHYDIVDSARKALVAINPDVDFSQISDIRWYDVNKKRGVMMSFSDDKYNYTVYKVPTSPNGYYTRIRKKFE